MPTPVPVAQTPNQIAAAAAPARAGSNGANNSVPVPTAAPTGQVSTSQPAAASTPAAVVSSNTAADHVNNAIVPAMQAGQAAVASQAAAKAATPGIVDPVKYYGNPAGTPTFDSNGKPITPPQQSASSSSQTPEERIMSQPDAGNKFVYDAQGNQVEIGAHDIVPTGYSATNPKVGPTTPISQTAIDPLGNQYVQYSDGTYGKYNSAGQYVGAANATDFNTNQQGQSVLSSLNSALTGSYPLTASQQAQIDGVKAQFQQLITQQATANANFTGGVTVAENLYGMGNSLTGLGEIKGTVDAGIAKIADLNSKMVSAVDTMTDAFNKDNIDNLKTAYTIYNTAAKDRQAEIDNIQKTMQAAQDKADAAVQKNKDQVDAVLIEATKNGASPAVIEAIRNSPNEGAAVQAAGNSLEVLTGAFAGYPVYRNEMASKGLVPLGPTEWKDNEDKKAASLKASEAYSTAYNAEAGKTAATLKGYSDPKLQDKLEKQYVDNIEKEKTSRGILGSVVTNINQANKISSLFNKYYDPKTGDYNVPPVAYSAIASEVSSLLSKTGTPLSGSVDDIKAATARGDFGKAYQYWTGTPANGSSQDTLKSLIGLIDTEGQTVNESKKENLASIPVPTGLDPSRASRVSDVNTISYRPIQDAGKDVQDYVRANPSQAENIAKALEVPGVTPEMIKERLKI